MPVLTFPSETADRLNARIKSFGENHRTKLFPATDVALGLVFTLDEIREFGGESGDAMVLAVADLEALQAAIPEWEGDQRNYCIIRHEKAIARLEPFAGS